MRHVVSFSLIMAIIACGATTAFAGITVKATKGFDTTLQVDVPKVDLKTVDVLGKDATLVTIPDGSLAYTKDAPALPRLTAMVMVDPNRNPTFTVSRSQIEVIDLKAPVAPSKGNFTRDIDPSTVPYHFGSVYSQDAWYPADNELVAVGEPYIFRDIRGVNLVVNPVQYNPAKNQIRIHRSMNIAMATDDKPAKNVIKHQTPISSVYAPIYQNVFVNFKQASRRLPKIEENGNLLIICHDDFVAEMAPFIAWKKKIGLKLEIVKMSEIGTTADQVKAFIKEYYDAKGVTHIMLVGDAQHIPTLKGVKERADSDGCYTKLAGDDHVPDAIICRLSAEDKAGVAYQVAKFVNYEQFPTVDNAAWYSKAMGVASNEGNPKDWEYMDKNRDALVAAMFKDIAKVYDPSATKAMVSTAVNGGISLINYLGHGSGTSWGTTRFSNSDVNQLSNGWMLPIIWDVACVNGKFVNYTGFGESWLRSGNIEKPAGAVSYAGSTTNMEWVPPIHVQMAFNIDFIAKEVYKTTGGTFINGIMVGLEKYGVAPTGSGVMMYEQWHLFGDSTMICRFKAPQKVVADVTTEGNTVKVLVRGEEGKGLENARVTFYTKGCENLRVATTNDRGEAVVTAEEGLAEGFITVFGADIVPVVDQPVTF